MPEGDTAWRTARQLHRALAGHVLTRSDLRVPAFATVDLRGEVVEEALSRGKHLLIRVGSFSIHTHLKMEGHWQVRRRGSPWLRPAHTARIVLETAEHQAVGFSLGITEVLGRDADGLDWLGPDLLGPDWDLGEAIRRVTADGERPIFLALHDQRNLAGFGNEYVNELCFLSGVAPTRPVSEVANLARILERGRQMMIANRERVERTFTGQLRKGERHWVFARERLACRRCGTVVRRGELGDTPTRRRNMFWCPHCQA